MWRNGHLERSAHKEVMRLVKRAIDDRNRELDSEIISQRYKISKLQSEYEETKTFLLHNEQVS